VTAGSSIDCPADGLDEVVALDLLEHVARGPGHDGREERLVLVVGGQDDGRDRGIDRAHVPAHLHPGAVGQALVEDGDVGTQRRDPPGGLLGRPRLSHHLDVALALEQVAGAASHQLVVVEQVDPDHRALARPGRAVDF
jgi:hypothetical protein